MPPNNHKERDDCLICDFKTDEQKDRWFDAKMFRHYIILLGLFLALGTGLVVWGFNKNTIDSLQDERIYEMKKSMDEIKQQGKETLLKVNEIDKKITQDGRMSMYIPGER